MKNPARLDDVEDAGVEALLAEEALDILVAAQGQVVLVQQLLQGSPATSPRGSRSALVQPSITLLVAEPKHRCWCRAGSSQLPLQILQFLEKPSSALLSRLGPLVQV